MLLGDRCNFGGKVSGISILTLTLTAFLAE